MLAALQRSADLAARSGLVVDVIEAVPGTPGLDALPESIAADVYFCCNELLQNVVKYADAAHAWITVERHNDRVLFEVRDDGVGMDTAGATPDVFGGLAALADRVGAHGGVLIATRPPSGGTSVRGEVPLSAAAVVAP